MNRGVLRCPYTTGLGTTDIQREPEETVIEQTSRIIIHRYPLLWQGRVVRNSNIDEYRNTGNASKGSTQEF